MNHRTTSGPDNVRGPADEYKKPAVPSDNGPRCGCGAVSGVHYCPNVNPPTRPAHDLTPSDVTLSKMLAAYDAWSGGEDNQSADILGELSEVMVERGLLDIERALTIDGAALLDRARKAGVL